MPGANEELKHDSSQFNVQTFNGAKSIIRHKKK